MLFSRIFSKPTTTVKKYIANRNNEMNKALNSTFAKVLGQCSSMIYFSKWHKNNVTSDIRQHLVRIYQIYFQYKARMLWPQQDKAWGCSGAWAKAWTPCPWGFKANVETQEGKRDGGHRFHYFTKLKKILHYESLSDDVKKSDRSLN